MANQQEIAIALVEKHADHLPHAQILVDTARWPRRPRAAASITTFPQHRRSP